ncbi:bifunctional 2-dehydro-3-deoxygluconokinase/2-dehydro-3-deoxygalactonokinase [Halolamina sp.]|jgi:2-dehydro-3-deoxygluconokinase|uniref:bifunctional 2-dehydro-3-deoxygluconokinase/2-dehydro-3- deoxygalactonokinase n=1 Tax=Halolamina sp. TaxID=1940283 RepID=UPI000223BC22|nr:PfkB domain protein [halophilic archaeon DL31]
MVEDDRETGPGIVTFGESMLRLGTPAGERLVTADALNLHIGGAESNVAADASRLGAETVWLSKLPESPLADRVVEGITRHGVDARVARGEGRVGTYYLDAGGAPRGTEVVYDREGTAIRSATPEELDTAAIEAAETFLVTGITPALSGTLEATTRTLLETAREAGTKTVFDPNYRAKLWSPAEARETLTELLPLVDTLVVAERDAREVLAREGSPEAIAAELAAEFGHETVVLTRGAEGSLAWADGETHEQAAFDAETHDAVGSGDAFVAGFLVARGDGQSVPEALSWGSATASLKRTIAGDVAVIDRADVERVRSDASGIER